MVARENAQPAGINGDGFAQAVFCRKIGNGGFWRHIRAERADGFGHVGVKLGDDLTVKIHVVFVFQQIAEALRVGLLKHLERITPAFPMGGAQGHEQCLGLVVPAPPHIVGNVAQAGKLFRHLGNGHDGPQKWRGGTRCGKHPRKRRMPAVTVNPGGGFFESYLKSPDVVFKKELPR